MLSLWIGLTLGLMFSQWLVGRPTRRDLRELLRVRNFMRDNPNHPAAAFFNADAADEAIKALRAKNLTNWKRVGLAAFGPLYVAYMLIMLAVWKIQEFNGDYSNDHLINLTDDATIREEHGLIR